MKIRIQTVVKIVVSLAAIGIVIIVLRGVDLGRALGIILGANLAILALVLLVQAASIFLRLVRWKYQLLPAQDVPLSVLISPLLVSFAVGNVTVTGVGVVPRSYLLARRTGIDGAFAAGTWFQEYVLDATAVVIWAVVVPFVVTLPPAFRQVQIVLLPLLAILFLVCLAFWRCSSILVELLKRLDVWERILSLLPDWVARRRDAFSQGLCAAFAYPGARVVVPLATMIIWAIEALIFWLLLLSLGIPFDYLEASAIMAFTHVVIGVPSVPGFIGTLEVATVGMVLALGGDQAGALAYVVLLRLFFTGPSTLLGVFFAWREGWRIA